MWAVTYQRVAPALELRLATPDAASPYYLLKDFVKRNILRQRLSRFLTCSFCHTDKFFHRDSFIFWQVTESC